MASLESSNPIIPNPPISAPDSSGWPTPESIMRNSAPNNHARASHHSQSSDDANVSVLPSFNTTSIAPVVSDGFSPPTGVVHRSDDFSGGVLLVFFILLIPGTYFFTKLADKLFNWVIEKTKNSSGIEQFFLALARYCVISAAVLAYSVMVSKENPFALFWLYMSYVFALVVIEVPRLLYYKLRGKSYTPSVIFRWGIVAGSLWIFACFIRDGNGGGTAYHSSSSTDYASSYHSSLDVAHSSLDVNPATGHIMVGGIGGVDTSGNSYGSSGF